MSHYIRCDQCGCDSLDTDTLRCSCGSDAPTSCAAAERFSAELRALRRVASAAKKAEQVFAAYWADDMDCGKPLPNEEFIEVRKALKEAGL